MIIYIELFLLSNLIIHLLSIFIAAKINKLIVTKGVILSSILDIVWMIFYIYSYDFFADYTFIVGIFLVIICFRFNLINYIKVIITYYFANYLLGGLVLTTNLKGNLLFFSVIICYFFIVFCIYLFLVKQQYETFYDVSIHLDKIYHLRAFFDTGCNLSYAGKPVIVIRINKRIKVNYCGHMKVIGATGEMVIPCFEISKIVVNKVELSGYGIFLDVEYEAIIGGKFI